MGRLIKGENDLETYCKQNGKEDLLKEWHPTKNGGLKPSDVTAGSHMKVWWLLPYDDTNTGKHFDFEWEATISNRILGRGCPYISGQKVLKGYNDLETKYPDIAKEWHPTKNGSLKPSDIVAGSGKKVWWLLSYNDKETEKHFDFEWEAIIKDRVKGSGCPYLCGKQVYKGFNDLESQYPDIAKEWHPTKNGGLKPSDVTIGSIKKVWWMLPYDDVKTGKHFDFEWESTIGNRVQGNGCPYICGKGVWKGFNDLESQYPDIAREWHPTKNGDLKPSDVIAGSEKKVWWYFPYDDINTGRHFDFEWEARIADRIKGMGCPYICTANAKVYKGFNDLETLYPQIASEWHPAKNGKLKPSDVTVSSGKKVWWLLPYDDIKSGKHYDFEWESIIANRVKGSGCPYLCGKQVYKGFNDLETLYPQIAREWHPTKNGKLKPSNVTVSSGEKVWWLLPYDDIKSGKHFDFEWESIIASRVKGSGCPYLCGKQVYKGFNDLETLYPQIAREWHPTKNGDIKPSDVTIGSEKKIWWQCEYKHEWKAIIANRVHLERGCTYCSGSKTERLLYAFCKKNDIAFIAEKKFNDIPIKFYPYDLYLYKSNLVIEADGKHHFESIDYFDLSVKFEERVKRDNAKNEYCLKRKMPILRIPYIYDVIKEKDKIEGIVKEFIRTRKVPQEILDFYEPFKESIGSNYFDVASELNRLS